MLLWFVVLAPVAVAEIFRSPMVDYRLVALGAVLPLAEAVLAVDGVNRIPDNVSMAEASVAVTSTTGVLVRR